MIGRFNIINKSVLPKLIYSFTRIPIKSRARLPVDVHKLILNAHGKTQDLEQQPQFWKRWSHWEEHERVPDFQHSSVDSVEGGRADTKTKGSEWRTRQNPRQYVQKQKRASPAGDAGATGHARWEMKVDLSFTSYKKMKTKCIMA